jgi:hypothetical protein
LSRKSGGTTWKLTDGHHHVIAGGWEGDPGAAFLNPSGFSLQIMNCGHAATPDTMQCARSALSTTSEGHYERVDDIYSLGTKTFAAGASPVMANVLYRGARYIELFALSTDNQIWQKRYHVPSNSWGIWYQVPSLSGGFKSDPAAATYTASGDLLIVCARFGSSDQISCNKQVYGNGGTISWGGWNTVPGFISNVLEPSITRSANSVHLFSTHFSTFENTASFPLGGGSWSGTTLVGAGNSFLSGPSACASVVISGPNMATVAKGGDSAFWHGAINTAGWNWTQIQVD